MPSSSAFPPTARVELELEKMKAQLGTGGAGAPAQIEGQPRQQGGAAVIIRILAEGQFDVPDVRRSTDSTSSTAALEAAVESGDEATLGAALGALARPRARLRQRRSPVDSLVPSDLVLPHPAATLAEIKDLISGDGLIPG